MDSYSLLNSKKDSIVNFIKSNIIYGHNQNRSFQRRLEKIERIDNKAGVTVIECLEDVSPALGIYAIEYPFKNVYSRKNLGNRTKELTVVAALAAMGTASPQLRVHINAILHVGVTSEEISEVIVLMSIYAGFPAALHGT